MRDAIEIGVFIIRVLLITEIPFITRIDLVVSAFLSLFGLIFFKKKKVRYFGHDFVHESIVGPVLIYPHEVASDLLRQIPNEKIKSVLDIGGNLGQFSITLANMNEVDRIDIIEPNPHIFGILKSNCSSYENIKCHNVAVGKPGNQKFYYEENKSATGSFVKNNAYFDAKSLKQVTVKVTDKIHSLTGRSKYDLIKIDVEGYEYQVIKHLKGISTKFLFLEISSNREKDYVTSELYGLLLERFGSFEVIFQSHTGKGVNSFDILLKFV